MEQVASGQVAARARSRRSVRDRWSSAPDPYAAHEADRAFLASLRGHTRLELVSMLHGFLPDWRLEAIRRAILRTTYGERS